MRFPKAVLRNASVLLILGPVLLNLGPVTTSVPGNLTQPHGQNSAKQCQNSAKPLYRPSPLQYSDELHQKDLRINLFLGHIWAPENELFLGPDTFLALSLIVAKTVSRGSY